MLSSKLYQEQPRPGVAGGTRASKLPSLGFSPSRHLKAASVGTNGEYSHVQFGSAGVPWFAATASANAFILFYPGLATSTVWALSITDPANTGIICQVRKFSGQNPTAPSWAVNTNSIDSMSFSYGMILLYGGVL